MMVDSAPGLHLSSLSHGLNWVFLEWVSEWVSERREEGEGMISSCGTVWAEEREEGGGVWKGE